MLDMGGNAFSSRCVRLVRFADLELRDAIGTIQEAPTPVDFFDCLSYCQTERAPYTGRAQSVNLDGHVIAEGYFQGGCPEGLWTRWHDNGQKREEFFIANGECARAQHWDEDGVPI
jgi:hypothetical protein|tara:strand:- start:741 stop:1088 length:348 start_codon:yes stop_codon:yes gene_type:complete